MKKLIFTLVLVLSSFFVPARTQYEERMSKAFGLWKAGNPTDASAMFASLALVNTTTAFEVVNNKEKVAFEMGKARYFKQDTKPMCAQIEKAIPLFSTFKPETVFHPNWGLDRALEVQKECAKK